MFGSCIHKGQIYVFGGLAGRMGQATSSIEKYDTFKGTWESLKVQLPKKISGISAVCVGKNDTILLFGGSIQGKNTKNIYEFDAKTEKIRQKSQ